MARTARPDRKVRRVRRVLLELTVQTAQPDHRAPLAQWARQVPTVRMA
jgi:hypothetical protein